MNWIRKAFGLCQHKWKVVEQYGIHKNSDKALIGTLYVMQCEHCGEIKHNRVSLR
jgi:hypothetical protein